MENEFPPNSITERPKRPTRESEKEVKRELPKVVTGRVIERERPLHKKFFDAFRPEDNKGFLEHILVDVLAIGIRDSLVEAAHNTIDNAFSGIGGGSSRGRSRGGSYTSYSAMSRNRSRGRERDHDRDRDRRPARRSSEPSDHIEVILETKAEADHVLDLIFEQMSRYDVVTVRDVRSAAGLRHEYTDEDWGWYDLRGARVHRVREGYLLDLPRAEALD